jgi:hypothetical protein
MAEHTAALNMPMPAEARRHGFPAKGLAVEGRDGSLSLSTMSAWIS